MRWFRGFKVTQLQSQIALSLLYSLLLLPFFSFNGHYCYWLHLGGEILEKLLNSRIAGSDWLIGTQLFLQFLNQCYMVFLSFPLAPCTEY